MSYLRYIEAAKLIVAAEKALYPGCEDAVAFDVGSGSGTQDTESRRVGETKQILQHSHPSFMSSALADLAHIKPITSTLNTSEQDFLSRLLNRIGSSVPNASELNSIATMPASGFIGEDALDAIIAKNPYAQDYETATNDLYERSFEKARAMAKSGPDNVRGGTARNGFELGEIDSAMSTGRFREVNDQQQKQAGIVSQAAAIANAIEQGRRGSSMSAIQQKMQGEIARDQQGLDATAGVSRNRMNNLANLSLATQTLSSPQNYVYEDMHGKGHQTSSSFNVGGGVSCCFIFLEVLNGQLPPYVRECRDRFVTNERRDGYNWMASWLVPWMRKYRVVLSAVNYVIVKPCLVYGRALGHLPGSRPWHRLLKPYVFAWFNIWGLLGKLKKKV